MRERPTASAATAALALRGPDEDEDDPDAASANENKALSPPRRLSPVVVSPSGMEGQQLALHSAPSLPPIRTIQDMQTTQRKADGVRVLRAMDPEAIDYSRLSVQEVEELRPDRKLRRKERDALLHFAHAAGAATWRERKGWEIDGTDVMVTGLQAWTGVTTSDVEDGRVTHLHLPNNNLRGFISPQLEHLAKLRSLCLRNNQLIGPAPDAVAPGKLMTELNLANNRLSGPLPSSIFRLRLLKKLNLSNNAFSGSIPSAVGQLVSLRELYLDFNQLSGAWPIELLVLLARLDAYRFRSNRFSLPAMGPEDDEALRDATSIVASDCGLSGEIPARLIALSSRLERFGLQMNDGLCLPSDPSPLLHLEVLDQLAMHDLTGPLPPSWSSLTSLRVLKLPLNQLTGTIPTRYGELSSLEVLDLSSNQLQGDIPPSLSRLTRLTELRLSRNALVGCLPEGLSCCQRLRSLAVDENRDLYGTLPDTWRVLSGLTELNLNSCKLTGPLPPCLSSMTCLRFLGLAGNGFTRELPPWLQNLTQLQHLHLHENRLDGKVPFSWLVRLSALQDLTLYHNNFQGPVPTYDDFRRHVLHIRHDDDDDDEEEAVDSGFARQISIVYVPRAVRERPPPSRSCSIA